MQEYFFPVVTGDAWNSSRESRRVRDRTACLSDRFNYATPLIRSGVLRALADSIWLRAEERNRVAQERQTALTWFLRGALTVREQCILIAPQFHRCLLESPAGYKFTNYRYFFSEDLISAMNPPTNTEAGSQACRRTPIRIRESSVVRNKSPPCLFVCSRDFYMGLFRST